MLIELLALTFVVQSPEIRRGFWMSGGYGVGTLACTGCSNQENPGQSWYLGLGGTVSKHVLIGLESNVSVVPNLGAELRSGYLLAFTTYWYPSSRGGLFFKGGLGSGFYFRRNSSPEVTSDDGVFMAGAGYDIRLGQRITIAPSLTFWTSTRADLQTDSATLATGFRHSGAALQIGLMYQSPWGASKTPHEPYPQTRKGFWWGLGFGGGNIAWQCDGCANQDHGAGSVFLRLGGTPSKHVLLGAEVSIAGPKIAGPFEQFGPDSLFNGVYASYLAFAVDWYPGAAGGFFFKSGIGASEYDHKTSSSEATSTSGAILIGAGYDLRVGRMTSVTPMVTLWGSSTGDLKDGTGLVATGLRHTGAMFQIGVTLH